MVKSRKREKFLPLEGDLRAHTGALSLLAASSAPSSPLPRPPPPPALAARSRHFALTQRVAPLGCEAERGQIHSRRSMKMLWKLTDNIKYEDCEVSAALAQLSSRPQARSCTSRVSSPPRSPLRGAVETNFPQRSARLSDSPKESRGEAAEGG